MKKIVLAAMICLAFVGTTQAQYKPEAGSFTTELQFTPMGNLVSNVNTSGLGISGAPSPIFGLDLGFKGRYFISDNLAVRLTLGFGNTTLKEVDYNMYSDGKEYEDVLKTKTSNFVIAPGIEYHFAGFERLSPYVGAEFLFGTLTNKTDFTTSHNADYTKTKQKGTSLGINLVAGFDFYVYKGLYLGAELGFGYSSAKVKDTESEQQVGGVTTSVIPEDYDKTTTIGFNCKPAIRLGWRF